ncbi:MAG: amino acid racemase [Roseiflexaceae bacterium]|nr:amino acid racemase [Roseiflexaceae bacterium]
MKTIGVLGGLGPQATMDFEQRVHQVAQQLAPQRGTGGYPPMLVHYCRHPPVLSDADLNPIFPLQPDPRMFVAARMLGQVADFLVITSNGVHFMQAALEEAAGRPILSMIEATLAEVARRGWQRVGVLAFQTPQIYAQALELRGLQSESVDASVQTKLNQVMWAVVEGRAEPWASEVMRSALETLRARGVDGVILGCTEFPFVLPDELDAPDIINPIAMLAEAAVRHAMANSHQP